MKLEDPYLSLSWEELHELAYELFLKLNKNGTFEYIAAIARGGLTIGHILSDFMRVPVVSSTWTSYRNMNKQSSLKMLSNFGIDFKDKRVLLVDDVSDTGETLKYARDHVKEHKPRSVHTATLHVKPHTNFVPDFYVNETDKWIVYPFESWETAQTLVGIWVSEGVSRSSIESRLRALSLPGYVRDRALSDVQDNR